MTTLDPEAWVVHGDHLHTAELKSGCSLCGATSLHSVVAVPVRKMDSGTQIIAWRFSCSCGRDGDGWHKTAEKAVIAGEDHIRRSKVVHYVIHTDYDDPTDAGVYGPMPPEADLNDDVAELWAQCGEIDVVDAAEIEKMFGPPPWPWINPWSVWIEFGR